MDITTLVKGLTFFQSFWKRVFDAIFSFFGLLLSSWVIILAWLAATIDTGKNGFFTQCRVGQNGRVFKVIKIRTMRDVFGVDTNVTTSGDQRITPLGRFLRRCKIDELPQLINVLKGDMSFVGPRPDVPGFADRLEGKDRLILSIRPGITGPATLKYRDEQNILAQVDDPEKFNREVIFPDKVRLNRDYVENYSFWSDIHYIWKTVFPKSNPKAASINQIRDLTSTSESNWSQTIIEEREDRL